MVASDNPRSSDAPDTVELMSPFLLSATSRLQARTQDKADCVFFCEGKEVVVVDVDSLDARKVAWCPQDEIGLGSVVGSEIHMTSNDSRYDSQQEDTMMMVMIITDKLAN